MNKRFLFLLSFLCVALFASAQEVDVKKMLEGIESVTSIENIEKADTTRQYFLMKFTSSSTRRMLLPVLSSSV